MLLELEAVGSFTIFMLLELKTAKNRHEVYGPAPRGDEL